MMSNRTSCAKSVQHSLPSTPRTRHSSIDATYSQRGWLSQPSQKHLDGPADHIEVELQSRTVGKL